MGTRYGLIGPYLPSRSGSAVFIAALRASMAASDGDEARVVAVVETPLPRPAFAVVAQWSKGDRASLAAAAEQLNACDAVIVHHEFDSYGGADGREVLDLLDALTVPRIVVLPDVLVHPTSGQREVVDAIAVRAEAVVALTVVARDELERNYSVDAARLTVIAHGAADLSNTHTAPSALFRGSSRTVLTWGLLGPGQGIEWGIEAMDRLRDLMPAPTYVIAGETDPKVLAREGETYRDSLSGHIKRLGLGAAVRMDRRQLDAHGLADLIASADVVLLPYESTDDITSSVLVAAIAAGKPVVATAFPHAVEMLSDGAGLVVAHQDPAAIADALRSVLTRADIAVKMSALAVSAAPPLRWSAVAERYRELAARLIAPAAGASGVR